MRGSSAEDRVIAKKSLSFFKDNCVSIPANKSRKIIPISLKKEIISVSIAVKFFEIIPRLKNIPVNK